jgi:hypothetical protein
VSGDLHGREELKNRRPATPNPPPNCQSVSASAGSPLLQGGLPSSVGRDVARWPWGVGAQAPKACGLDSSPRFSLVGF